MTIDQWLNLTMAVIFGLAVVVQSAYAFTYHLMARWEESPTGRALMSKALALLALLIMVFILFIPGQFPGETVVRVPVSIILLGALIFQYVTMVKVQKEVRSDEQAEDKRVEDDRRDSETL